MSYIHFTRDIEIPYQVSIRKWAHERFCNPSDLSNNVPALTKLRDALVSGECHFVKLNDEEHAAVKKKYEGMVADGLVPQRKKRKDAGEKRKASALENGEEGSRAPPAKRARQAEATVSPVGSPAAAAPTQATQ